jgi:hypothetical protein
MNEKQKLPTIKISLIRQSPSADKRPNFAMNLSVLAKRYGAYKGNDKVTDPDISHRSALTPIDTLFPVDLALLSQEDNEERILNSRIHGIRKRLFHGFTTRELVDVDAFMVRKLKVGNLTSPIIPPLQIHN